LSTQAAILGNQLYGTRARIARLAAERDNAGQIVFDQALLSEASADPERSDLLNAQIRLFDARAETLRRELAQLRTRQEQFRKEIAGLEAQKASTKKQLTLIGRELAGQRKLYKQGHARVVRVYELERRQAELAGRLGERESDIAQSQGRIAEIEIETLRLQATRREEAIAQLRTLRAEELDLAERYRATQTMLSRLEVRAPRAGTILDRSVHAVRAVVRAADPILYIVPSDSALVVEARVSPSNVDDLYPRQIASLRFSSLNARTTPELEGVVDTISADALTDDTSGESYFLVTLKIAKPELRKLHTRAIVPGMPVDVFLRTGERTPLSYMAKPFTDYFVKAMRES
ncbi:MAG: HlyD family type I secretion periplasmic adaptor subunit, partial [Pseudomonadota bacterium]